MAGGERSWRRRWAKGRSTLITLFVIAWMLLFHYESSRHFILQPLFKRNLPKTRLLFPPAGWIMFYKYSPSFSHVDVVGIKGVQQIRIDPHDIFRVRTIGYDNIHRGIMGQVADTRRAQAFCGYLARRFQGFDRFAIVLTYYPNPSKDRYDLRQQVLYQCGGRPAVDK